MAVKWMDDCPFCRFSLKGATKQERKAHVKAHKDNAETNHVCLGHVYPSEIVDGVEVAEIEDVLEAQREHNEVCLGMEVEE